MEMTLNLREVEVKEILRQHFLKQGYDPISFRFHIDGPYNSPTDPGNGLTCDIRCKRTDHA
jgi:hypothetical protein